MKIIFQITELSSSLSILELHNDSFAFRKKNLFTQRSSMEIGTELKKYSFIYGMNWWSISIILCPKQPRLNVEHYHYMHSNLLICQLCLSNKARIFGLANKNLSEVSNTGYWKGFFFTNVEKQIKKGNEWSLYLFVD